MWERDFEEFKQINFCLAEPYKDIKNLLFLEYLQFIEKLSILNFREIEKLRIVTLFR